MHIGHICTMGLYAAAAATAAAAVAAAAAKSTELPTRICPGGSGLEAGFVRSFVRGLCRPLCGFVQAR